MNRRALVASPFRRAGFTLVELLMVLAIAALLMTAVPSLFSAAFPGVELKSAARRIAATLRLARETAIQRGTETTLLVDVEARQLALQGYRTLHLPQRLTLELETASRELLNDEQGAIRFFPDGSSTGGRLLVTYREHGYQVGVTWLTGRVELAPWETP